MKSHFKAGFDLTKQEGRETFLAFPYWFILLKLLLIFTGLRGGKSRVLLSIYTRVTGKKTNFIIFSGVASDLHWGEVKSTCPVRLCSHSLPSAASQCPICYIAFHSFRILPRKPVIPNALSCFFFPLAFYFPSAAIQWACSLFHVKTLNFTAPSSC